MSHPNFKRGSKTLFTDDIIISVENPKESTEKLLVLADKFSMIVGQKANTQEKSVVLLYTSHQQL